MSEARQPVPVVSELLDWLCVSNLRCYLALAALMLAFALPGFFTLQPMDRDEPRFAQASKQMLESGDFVSIRFQQEARNKKPVGIYWMQAAAVAAGETIGVPEARQQIWLYRLPSLVGAVTTTLATFWMAQFFVPRRRAILAGALLASTILLGVEAHLAKTDAMLTATVVIAMGVLARLVLRGDLRPRHIALFWGAMAVGILVKGPLAPLFPALVILAWAYRQRSLRWFLPLKPLIGLLVLVAAVAPWFILIAIKTHGAFFADSLGQDMISKVAGGQESHGAPPLTYFALFWLTAWPLAPLTLLAAPKIWAQRSEPATLFLLFWIAPAWLIFELVPTKLPHYVLPLYPAIAILSVLNAPDALSASRGALRWLAAALALVPPVVLAAGAALLWLNLAVPLIPSWAADFETPHTLGWLPMAVMILASLVAAFAAVGRLYQAQTAAYVLYGVASAAFLSLAIYSFVLTSAAFAPAQMPVRLAEAQQEATKLTSCPHLDPASTYFREPSLVFLTQTNLQFLDGAQAAAFLSEAPCRIAFVDGRDEPAFLTAMPDNLPHEPVQRLGGVNLANGKRLDIGVYVRQ